MDKRIYLRDKMKLCGRATQRVLIYSNNFLHKRLKTEERGCRAVRVKGKAAMGMLKPLAELAKDRCCVDNCVMMVFSHKMLLQHWRDSACQGQLEARRVLAEMLTPSGGARTNCYKFISWVTGCSNSTISKVSDQMKRTGGEREPPLHGMKKYWQNKQKKCQDTQTQDHTDNPRASNITMVTQQATPTQALQQAMATSKPDTTQSGVKIVTVTQFEQQLLQLQQQLIEHQIQLQQQQRLVQQQLLQQALLQNLAHAEKSQNLSVAQQIMNQLNQLQSTQQPQATQQPQQISGGGLIAQQDIPAGMATPKNIVDPVFLFSGSPSSLTLPADPQANRPWKK
ncbi:hypothetical protein ScPMuIL_011317 [Solemya velum]